MRINRRNGIARCQRHELLAPAHKEPIWARSVKDWVRFRAILVLELVADLGDTVRC
jgi:hypothetical protein